MSSTNKTPNYDLPQWVASDPVEMADFNQAMSDIDTNLNLVDERTKLKYSFVGLSSPLAIATATWTAVGFSLLVSTDSSFYNPATPDRLIVPHGVSKIKFSCQAGFSTNSTGVRKISVAKNGVVFQGITEMSSVGNPTLEVVLNANSPIIDVYEGDYFQMNVHQTSGVSLVLAKNSTWFSIEAVE